MILAHGKIYENKEQDSIIASLQSDICETLMGPKLNTEDVINACDRLSKKAASGAYDGIAKPLLEYVQISYADFPFWPSMPSLPSVPSFPSFPSLPSAPFAPSAPLDPIKDDSHCSSVPL